MCMCVRMLHVCCMTCVCVCVCVCVCDIVHTYVQVCYV